MINDGANPLAEVALALAMAFFSLMILMLFAMVNAPQTDGTATAAATVQMSADTSTKTTDDRERQLIIYTEDGLFDAALSRIDPASIDRQQPVILAVSDRMPISSITSFQRQHPGLTLEIAELTPDWQARLAASHGKAGQ